MAYEILWRVHALLMSTSYLALFSGILISLFFKKKKWRHKTHRNLGIYAGISGVTALILAFVMVQIFSGVHFTSLHAIAGGVTGLILILTPPAGRQIRKVKDKKRMKRIHRIMGYTTAAFMAVTILFGLMFVGILSFPV